MRFRRNRTKPTAESTAAEPIDDAAAESDDAASIDDSEVDSSGDDSSDGDALSDDSNDDSSDDSPADAPATDTVEDPDESAIDEPGDVEPGDDADDADDADGDDEAADSDADEEADDSAAESASASADEDSDDETGETDDSDDAEDSTDATVRNSKKKKVEFDDPEPKGRFGWLKPRKRKIDYGPDYTVRVATLPDLERFPEDGHVHPEIVRSWMALQQFGEAMLLVSWVKRAPAGYVMVSWTGDWNDEIRALHPNTPALCNFWVDEEHDGEGVELKLIEAAVTVCEKQGKRDLLASVEDDNASLRAALDELGFTETGETTSESYVYRDSDGKKKRGKLTSSVLLKDFTGKASGSSDDDDDADESDDSKTAEAEDDAKTADVEDDASSDDTDTTDAATVKPSARRSGAKVVSRNASTRKKS